MSALPAHYDALRDAFGYDQPAVDAADLSRAWPAQGNGQPTGAARR